MGVIMSYNECYNGPCSLIDIYKNLMDVIMGVIMSYNQKQGRNNSVRLLGIFPKQTREEITKQGRNKVCRKRSLNCSHFLAILNHFMAFLAI